MNIYTERPRQRRARKAWDHFAAIQPRKTIKAVWKNPNCWSSPSGVGNAWGWWVAEYTDGSFENTLPSLIP